MCKRTARASDSECVTMYIKGAKYVTNMKKRYVPRSIIQHWFMAWSWRVNQLSICFAIKNLWTILDLLRIRFSIQMSLKYKDTFIQISYIHRIRINVTKIINGYKCIRYGKTEITSVLLTTHGVKSPDDALSLTAELHACCLFFTP